MVGRGGVCDIPEPQNGGPFITAGCSDHKWTSHNNLINRSNTLHTINAVEGKKLLKIARAVQKSCFQGEGRSMDRQTNRPTLQGDNIRENRLISGENQQNIREF